MKKLLLFVFTVLLPAVIVGISNYKVFPESNWVVTLMLIVTVGIAGIFTWQSGEATLKISRYCICADFVICAILCINVGCHWLLAREVSAAKQGVEERRAEEDREENHRAAEVERQLALKKAELDLQNAEAKRLARLPRSERRSAIRPVGESESWQVIPPHPTKAAMAALKASPSPEQVRDWWLWYLTALAFAECFASVLAGAILAGIWEWDRNRDGIPDHLQAKGRTGELHEAESLQKLIDEINEIRAYQTGKLQELEGKENRR